MTRTMLSMFLLGTLSLPVAAEANDCLHDLAQAIERFRGIGYPNVNSYRVQVLLPEDPEEENVPLEEIWRAPRSLVLRAAKPGTHPAIVRSLALYLEPLYVARTSLLDADWEGYAERVREASEVSCSKNGSSRFISVTVPESGFEPSEDLPQSFEDLSHFKGTLDEFGRLEHLQVRFRGDTAQEVLVLECRYDEAGKRPQPDLATWTLPQGSSVKIHTTFRDEEGRVVPDSRLITFPSRYDPGETEEISVRYASYGIDVEIADEVFAGPGAFRYDANGLVAD